MTGALKHLQNGTRVAAFLAGALVFFSAAEVSCADGLGRSPIGAVARLFNPKLVKIEDRVEFLEKKLTTLVRHEEHYLKTGLGYKGARLNGSDPDPEIILDLGRDFPIDEIYLVPVQGESSGTNPIFPKRFTLELSSEKDFSKRRVLYKSSDQFSPEAVGKPLKFEGAGSRARYVRLTVNQGQLRGNREVFGLSEMVVMSDGYPVSLGATVWDSADVVVENVWYAEALIDGRMPLGTWLGANWVDGDSRGELIEVSSASAEVSWSLSLGESVLLDLVILYPYDFQEVLEAGIFPESLEVQVRDSPEEAFRTVMVWNTPVRGINQEVPLVLNCAGITASEVRILGSEARKLGGKYFHGISEIEVWSGHKNISAGLPVEMVGESVRTETKTLTNGFTSERVIAGMGTWLSQLHERWRVEREIAALQPMRNQMAAKSELNATWGSAMMLGLTFLIPVFIVERRRLISRNQVDQLRKRIASDLHDDIGSNLGSISLIARTARRDLMRLHGPEAVGADLGEMESIALESSLAMRDIVWLLERKQDSIGDLIQRMRDTAGRMLREIDHTMDCEATKSTSKLSLDGKRHLFLFFKECIHNVVKHSGATSVSIRLWEDGDKMGLEVVDNGKGLPVVSGDGGEKLMRVRKLDERAKMLEGQVSFSSSPDSGTRVLLSVKRSLLIASPTNQ